MRSRLVRVAAVAVILVIAAACSRSTPSPSVVTIALTSPSDGGTASVEVTGLPADTLTAIRDQTLTADAWSGILRVAVQEAGSAMLGTYSVVNGALRFTPMFPFDPGRQYHVRFDPARVPGNAASTATAIVATVGRPAQHTNPSTVVTRVYPSGDVVPENLLRIYVEFSGAMGRPSGIPHMKLLDESGKEIEAAFLPLDYEFWSPDHTRFTAFLDPGRVKGGILPNQQMGRALKAGHSVTLVISREWRDEHGLPLKEDYRRVWRAGPVDHQPLKTATWQVQPPPAAGTRDRLVVTFPEPLDHGLLMRALGVRRNSQPIDGDVVVDATETRWSFTPREPWRAGTHDLLALDILEDVAGNQIGRAFEVDNFDTVDKSPNPQSITIPFTVGAAVTP